MRYHFLPMISVVALLAGPAVSGGLGDMTEEEKAAFRAEVRAYLLDNPEVLMEAMQVLQEREDAAAAAQEEAVMAESREFLFNDPNSWVGGNPDGDVTIVEFMDYRCGYCRKAYDELMSLVANDGNIRFIVKEFPILGEDSDVSSRFAIAVRLVHGDAAYEAAHDALIKLRGSPDVPTLERLAGELGLDAGQVMARMGGEDVTAIITANHEFARAMNITGTPTFFVGDTILRGYLPLQEMERIVAEARAG